MPDSLWRTNRDIEDLFRRHHATVYRVCLLHLKNRADAEDMTQNVFLRMMSNHTAFVNSEHEKAWLIRAATGMCHNTWRTPWRNTEALDETIAAPEHAPDATLALVLALPPKYRAALYLHYYEGYTATEIGNMLGGREATARSWLLRGRQMLKMQLEEENHE